MKRTILTIIIIFIMSSISAAQEPISNLIVPVSYFVNHIKQLSLVNNNLAKHRKASVVGISGMGKTQLVRMYTYENKDKYKLIWFFDCNLDINEEFVKLAKAINRHLKGNIVSEDATQARKDIISYLTSQNKWLLVFDNLKISENSKIKEFIDWEYNGHIIFSSQDSELLSNIVKMEAFKHQDAITLASNLVRTDNTNLIQFLAKEFAGYPILIVQGAQLLNQIPGLSYQEYKKKIQQSTDKIKLNITLAIRELKPSARELLHKIALINNQSFSKDLLRIIANDKSTIDYDIYTLSKFSFISNIDANQDNPVFEMHDIIAQKIREMNGVNNNKTCLDQIITSITNVMPTKGKHQGYIFYTAKTISENIKIISDYENKYNLNTYKLLSLKLLLLQNYINKSQYYQAGKLFDWFDKLDKAGKFNRFTMSNDELLAYARYLSISGGYCKTRLINWSKALEYYLRAKEILNKIAGYENIKCNVLYNIASSRISLGLIKEAKQDIAAIWQDSSFSNDIKENGARIIKSKLYHQIGDEEAALQESNKEINNIIRSGIKADDVYLTHNYLLRSEILNSISRYKEALIQAQKIYDMHINVTLKNNEIFGQIFTQISVAKLGLGYAKEALEYASKARDIFINDPNRGNADLTTSTDIYLAKALVASGNALAALGQNDKSMKSYTVAENLYWNNYQNNMNNVDEISRMYLDAAKSACSLPEKGWYAKFHDEHITRFGSQHPRSIELLNMDTKCYHQGTTIP